MSELDMKVRGAAVLGVVQGIDDTGVAQTISVLTHDGVLRSDVEVMSIHGLTSNPGTGAVALLIAIEGDQGHYVALPLSLPGHRYGGQPPGGAGICDDAGNRLVFPGDGSGLLTVAGLFRMVVQTLKIEAQAGTTFYGPVVFEDSVEFKSDVTVRGNLAVGGNITAGGSITPGTPIPSAPPVGPGTA